MKRINQAVKYGAGASLAALAVAAHAEVRADVTNVITNSGTDGALVAGAIFGGLVAIMVVKYLRRAL